MIPNFQYERTLWARGKKYIAGIDEVGRGALAGPLVVAAVVFPIDFVADFLKRVNDSKKVKALERIKLASLIAQSSSFTIASTPVSYINKHGIAKATFKAMRHAITSLPNCDHFLVDAFYIPHFKNFSQNQTPIIKGDEKSLSIAAASIIAKVHRDRLMKRLHRQFPEYGFGKHKGYGTKKHKAAILEHGPLNHHRLDFIRKLTNQP